MIQSKQPIPSPSAEAALAMKVSVVSIVVNILLSLLKLAAGILARSSAMVSDAVHSASDVFSTLVVMIGITMAKKKPDKDHPYGHDRLECVASLLLAVALAVTGLGIGMAGVQTILHADSHTLTVPGLPALAVAILSILAKEGMYHYTRRVAKQINSGALMADAWHHRSDALSSVGSFVGILGARLGFPVLDPLVSVLICVMIEIAALDIFRDAVDRMVDKACPEATEEEMKRVILSVPGVLGIDEIKTRLFGAKIYLEVEIRMDASQTFVQAHETAEKVHETVETQFPDVKHCMVHVNPDIREGTT